MTYAIEVASGGTIYYTSSFMKIGRDVQAIVGFNLNNLIVCNAGISAGRDL
jgi:hypothetical protein